MFDMHFMILVWTMSYLKNMAFLTYTIAHYQGETWMLCFSFFCGPSLYPVSGFNRT